MMTAYWGLSSTSAQDDLACFHCSAGGQSVKLLSFTAAHGRIKTWAKKTDRLGAVAKARSGPKYQAVPLPQQPTINEATNLPDCLTVVG